MAAGKVALVTGANAGLGLTLCERLLSEHKDLKLCLACRNKLRAEVAQEALKLSHPDADISIIIVDTSSLQSVYRAAREIKHRYSRLDLLYLNAGIMPVTGFNWSHFVKGLFSSDCVHMLTTAKGLLKQADFTTEEGFRNIFATNLFGHFVLIRQLEEIIGCTNKPGHATQVVWTSSSAALKDNFDIKDIQHKNGCDPYSSSKYATDMLSVVLNDKLNHKGIYSHSVCPGLVMTNLTNGIMPPWFWTIMWPIIMLVRFFVPSTNYETYNGCEAQMWLSHQQPTTLDSHVKFCSESSVFGHRSVKQKKLNIDMEQAESLYAQLESLEGEFRQQHHKSGQ
ncbi:3-keto-steroid reductase/17-beta-hydroxysteroid dehydrogenase 7-like [Haliotis cracherodii]|uniref:3-keto-steroid reductase/17-beta-hydroxysteroid dehydrogenase 7-like n=1 Tax=Haliotis cracherodii TaxID=6455 RepID=UPI0039EB28B4